VAIVQVILLGLSVSTN